MCGTSRSSEGGGGGEWGGMTGLKNWQTAPAGRLPGGWGSFRTAARMQRSVNEE